jgi:hypothetical protein
MQESILTTLVLPVALATIMLGLGLSLKSDDFLRIFKYPKAVTIGLIGHLTNYCGRDRQNYPHATSNRGRINRTRAVSVRCIIEHDYLFGWWGCGIGCHSHCV